MRLPVSKLYRGFPELDPFNDEECERFVLRARAHCWILPWAGLAGAGGAVAWYLAASGVMMGLLALSGGDGGPWLRPNQRLSLIGGVLFLCLYGVGPPLAAGLAALKTRDWLLIRAIRGRVHLARCANCDHSLLGLPLLEGGRAPEGVRCPECGEVMVLRELGLTGADLMPRLATPS